MSFLLYVFYDDKKIEFDLENKNKLSIGTSLKSDAVIPVKYMKIKILAKVIENEGVMIKSAKEVDIAGSKGKKGFLPPENYCIISRNPFIGISLHKRIEDSPKTVDFSMIKSVTVGRNPDMDICLASSRVTGDKHAVIEKVGDSLILIDKSRNGTYVNGLKTKKCVLQNGDVISIEGYKFIIDKDILHFKNVGQDLLLNLKDVQEKKEGYPYFRVSPRLNRELPEGEIELKAPPNKEGKPEINWAAVIIPPILMVGVMAGAAFIMHSMTSLMITAPMMLITIITSTLNYRAQKKKYKRNNIARREKYEDYLSGVRNELSDAAQEYTDTLRAVHPDIDECFNIVKSRHRRLWERMSSEKDFMLLKIGIGDIPFSYKIKAAGSALTIDSDPLQIEAQNLRDDFSVFSGVPVCLDFKKYSTIGIIGNRSDAIAEATSIIIQAATHHSYEDVKIVVLYDCEEESAFSWARWLPHSWISS